MERRGLSVHEIQSVIAEPEQTIDLRPGRVLVQSIRVGDDQVYLLRVVLDVSSDQLDVVTAYKTSRIARYWKGVQ
jgi:hypothetical protein